MKKEKCVSNFKEPKIFIFLTRGRQQIGAQGLQGGHGSQIEGHGSHGNSHEISGQLN
jgi:hypothetical protein